MMEIVNATLVRPALTGAQVRAIYTAVLPQWDAHVCARADSELMAFVGTFLGGLGVVDQESWLTRYATTVGTRIYLPFVPGDEALWSLPKQIQTLAHELVHVEQWRDPTFAVTYATSGARRALWEVAGYAAGMEVAWALSGSVGDTGQIADALRTGYGCGAADVKAARVALERYAGIIRRGKSVARPAAAVVAAWRQSGGAR
jgi:hypothetical protein